MRLAPKKTAEVVWKFIKTGTFEFSCLIPDLREYGMTGHIRVKEFLNACRPAQAGRERKIADSGLAETRSCILIPRRGIIALIGIA